MKRSRPVFALAVLLVLAGVQPSFAQGAGSWELEVHGGGALTGDSGGAAAPLPSGTAILSLGGCPFCPSALRVSSWYFGDGTALLNDTVQLYRLSVESVALDAILGGGLARWPNGASIGMRIGRALTPRFGAEFALDYQIEALAVTEAALAGLEQSRGGFANGFTSLFTLPVFVNPRVSSTLDVAGGSAHRLDSTGVLIVNLMTRGRLIPYVAGGGGISSIVGDAPSATLNGTYQFAFLGVSPFDERDTVTVRASVDRHVAVGVFGGGVKWNISPRWGVRADIREHLSGSHIETLLDASPASTPAAALATATISGFEPSIQFSNLATIPTSLSGPALSGTTTFRNDGLHLETRVVGGVFFRF